MHALSETHRGAEKSLDQLVGELSESCDLACRMKIYTAKAQDFWIWRTGTQWLGGLGGPHESMRSRDEGERPFDALSGFKAAHRRVSEGGGPFSDCPAWL